MRAGKVTVTLILVNFQAYSAKSDSHLLKRAGTGCNAAVDDLTEDCHFPENSVWLYVFRYP